MTSATARAATEKPDAGAAEQPGERPADQQRTSGAAGTPTRDDDERLLGLIRAELDRQRAMPLARRTLELLVEAESEPSADEPGYRIVDRNGETRLRRDAHPGRDGKDGAKDADAAAPLTLSDLVGELRERYPDLFAAPPEPEPEPAPSPAPEPARDPLHDSLTDVKAAGARFVETQSALAKSLAASSAERGRALASAASERFEDWRTQLGERLKAQPAPAPAAGEPANLPAGTGAAVEAMPAASLAVPPALPEEAVPDAVSGRAGATQQAGGVSGGVSWAALRTAGLRLRLGGVRLRARLGDGTRGGAGRLTEVARRARDALPSFHPGDLDFSGLRRIAVVGIGGVAVLAVVVAGILFVRQEPVTETAAPSSESGPARTEAARDTSRDTSRDKPREAKAEPPSAAPAETGPKAKAPDAAPEDAEAAPGDEAPPQRNPGEIAGVPQVVDTATLRLSGKVVPLFGVQWVRGAQADELAKYLRGRAVACRPAPGSSAYLCAVDGRDLSEVVLFNGGGRASAEASPDLVAAEDHARSERLGIWKR